jgi:ferrous iron transport protein A
MAVMPGDNVMAGATGSRRQEAMPSLPLMLAARGQEWELVRIHGGRGLAFRLATMGLIPDARFKVQSGGRTGPILISFGGGRLILGHGMAQRMIVRSVCDQQR